MLGMTPTAFRNGGTNATIIFAVAESHLGSVVVALSQRGVCAILLGDQPEPLIQGLQNRFPRANLAWGTPKFEQLIRNAVHAAELPPAGRNLPLQIRTTAFQQRIWECLRELSVSL